MSQRELKTRFEILFESLSSTEKKSLAFLMQQGSLAFLGCGSVRIYTTGVSEGNEFIFKTFTRLVPSIVSHCSSAVSNIPSVLLTFEFNPIQIQ